MRHRATHSKGHVLVTITVHLFVGTKVSLVAIAKASVVVAFVPSFVESQFEATSNKFTLFLCDVLLACLIQYPPIICSIFLLFHFLFFIPLLTTFCFLFA